eukprot:Gregarina_sp_Poly_1__2666@NODE_172_length_12058_cov_51_176632_g153_i0_p2_GENE_NODE_172_length_12058_cov_51_176632_g153_i0NODE_172_length_12058_cov_51_176632_g153_i0_p2_ORF_typecomplete_len776_score109_07CRT10/PF08728_10/3_2e10WD40/PF00400_32/46WD40/PF00400_32/1_9e06WD40/PF00400_32/4_5e03ANAPC4_WD40/PF12894_7/2_1e05ANAPC4_WD40/PF12894_7/3_7e03ANAPC4_WD40/PF12894_7/1_5e04Ge1_WD40/PF16529_5/0_00059eIF2A/PF08662_11/2e03eIF2A/PF08662_11/0_053eIF2A/PF08662_11/4e02_NODE_172_length_12058_cov_51_176632_g
MHAKSALKHQVLVEDIKPKNGVLNALATTGDDRVLFLAGLQSIYAWQTDPVSGRVLGESNATNLRDLRAVALSPMPKPCDTYHIGLALVAINNIKSACTGNADLLLVALQNGAVGLWLQLLQSLVVKVEILGLPQWDRQNAVFANCYTLRVWPPFSDFGREIDKSVWGLCWHPYDPHKFVLSSNTHLGMMVDMRGRKENGQQVDYPWNAESCKVLRGHHDNVPCVSFSPAGHFVASVSIDKSTSIWSSATGELVCQAPLCHQWGWSVKWVPKSVIQSVKLWDFESLKIERNRQLTRVMSTLRDEKAAASSQFETPSESFASATSGDNGGVNGSPPESENREVVSPRRLSLADIRLNRGYNDRDFIRFYMLHEPWKFDSVWAVNSQGELEWRVTLGSIGSVDPAIVHCSISQALAREATCSRRHYSASSLHPRRISETFLFPQTLRDIISRLDIYQQELVRISRGSRGLFPPVSYRAASLRRLAALGDRAGEETTILTAPLDRLRLAFALEETGPDVNEYETETETEDDGDFQPVHVREPFEEGEFVSAEASSAECSKVELTAAEKCELMANVIIMGTENELVVGVFVEAPTGDIQMITEVIKSGDFRGGYMRSTLNGMDAIVYLEVDPTNGIILAASQGHFKVLAYKMCQCAYSHYYVLMPLISLPPYWGAPECPTGTLCSSVDQQTNSTQFEEAPKTPYIVRPSPWISEVDCNREKELQSQVSETLDASRIISLVWNPLYNNVTAVSDRIYRITLLTCSGVLLRFDLTVSYILD